MSGKIQTKAEAKADMLMMIGQGFGILTYHPVILGISTLDDMPEGCMNEAGNIEFSVPEVDWGVAKHAGLNNMRVVNGDDIGETLCRWTALIASPPILYWLGIDLEKQHAAVEAW